MMSLFRTMSLAFCLFSALNMGSQAVANELDGKRATCLFPADEAWKVREWFLVFKEDKVTVLQIRQTMEKNSEYGFDYSNVELLQQTEKVYVKPAYIFWSKMFNQSGDIDGISSLDGVGAEVLMGASGEWGYIERTTLLSQRGLAIMGRAAPTHTGSCELSDEGGEVSFRSKYQELKDMADEDYRRMLEESKSLTPKL